VKPEFTCRRRWRPKTLCIWENRALAQGNQRLPRSPPPDAPDHDRRRAVVL